MARQAMSSNLWAVHHAAIRTGTAFRRQRHGRCAYAGRYDRVVIPSSVGEV
jgi:hypothetical protein